MYVKRKTGRTALGYGGAAAYVVAANMPTSDPQIVTLQQKLNRWLSTKIAENGVLDAATIAAVVRFAKWYNSRSFSGVAITSNDAGIIRANLSDYIKKLDIVFGAGSSTSSGSSVGSAIQAGLTSLFSSAPKPAVTPTPAAPTPYVATASKSNSTMLIVGAVGLVGVLLLMRRK